MAEFHWEQLEGGPNVAHVEDLVLIGANASGLTKGKYDFRLTVKDALGNADSDEVTVTVAQDENEAPVADAGRDAEVTLPADSILFNGSKSHDDFRVRYLQNLVKLQLTRLREFCMQARPGIIGLQEEQNSCNQGMLI